MMANCREPRRQGVGVWCGPAQPVARLHWDRNQVATESRKTGTMAHTRRAVANPYWSRRFISSEDVTATERLHKQAAPPLQQDASPSGDDRFRCSESTGGPDEQARIPSSAALGSLAAGLGHRCDHVYRNFDL